MRYLLPVLALLLGACATTEPDGTGIRIETISRNQVIRGARCVASTNRDSWEFMAPATIDPGIPDGDLRIVCNKAGYRTSEYVFRPSQSSGSSLGIGLGGGGRVGGSIGLSFPIGGSVGRYPPKVSIEMSPGS